jgi:hypothetical protein
MMAHWPLIFLFHFLPFNNQTSADSIIKITAPEVIVHPGENATINVYVTVKKGFHIQSNKVNDEFIIPTTLEINTGKIITTGKQSFPGGKKFRLKGTDNYLLVYDGSFKITIPFKAGKKTQKGKYPLNAKLRYQACDSRTCFFPKIIDFRIFITIL